jgi:hypothetical protein
MDRALLLGAALFSFLGSAGVARAATNDELRAEARVIAEQGDAQFDAGRCDKAIPLWRTAESIFHAPTILLRVARCQTLLGKVVDAAGGLEAIAVEPLRPESPAPFFAAQAEAKRDLPLVRARIATLAVNVRVRGLRVPTRIEIDGVTMPEGRTSFPVDPGPRLVRVRAEGSLWERTVLLQDGERRACDVALWIDPPPPAPRTQRAIGLGAGGVGLAALVVGAGFSIAALTTSHHLDGVCGPDRTRCPASEQGAIGRVRAYSAIADGTLGGGAALAITGAVLLVAEAPPRAEGPRIRFAASPLRASIGAEF